MDDLRGWSIHEKEGIENMRRAAATLQPGDVIRYAYDRCPLILIVAVTGQGWTHTFHCIRMAFRGDRMDKRVEFALHGDWELFGHIDDWQALRDA